MKQLTLDDLAKRAENLQDLGIRRRPRKSTLRVSNRERFERFHAKNPHVLELLIAKALEAKARGKRRIGVKFLFEMARYNDEIHTVGDKYAWNNTYAAFYSRLITEKCPEVAGIIEQREQRSQ